MNIKKVMQLDILSVKPYFTLKNFVLLIVFSFFYTFMLKNPVIVVSMTQIFALLISSYPFMVGEETGIDPLFKILGIAPKEVVKGRYLVSILFVVCLLVVGIILSLLMVFLYPTPDLFSLFLISVPTTFVFTTFVIFVEYPVFFKIGYAKGRMIASLPFLIMGILFALAQAFPSALKEIANYFLQHRSEMLIGAFVLWALIGYVSIMLSQKFYSKRNF